MSRRPPLLGQPRRSAKDRAVDDRQGFPPDWAMLSMGIGAFCKFVELVLLRDSYHRYGFAISGGLMIALGAVMVTISTVRSIRAPQRLPPGVAASPQ
jgi:hypothetical protein